MLDFAFYGSASALLFWLITLLLPWQAWRVNEVLEADECSVQQCDLSDLTVLIPARNEAALIAATLGRTWAAGAKFASDSG